MLSTTEISGGFSSCRGNWVEHSNYCDDNNLCVIWAMYNDSSLMFPLPEYGFDSWMAFKQFTPLSNPRYRVTNGGQLFSPRQTHVTPPYNQHAVLPAPFHVTYVPAASHTELIHQEVVVKKTLSTVLILGQDLSAEEITLEIVSVISTNSQENMDLKNLCQVAQVP
ncbi:uncharacterized protein [Primulina eburnea]|uniref:uncharacterized protein n=1 Tax=Primulina eburnea TaxID=1245227 RepID=UPI003C6C28DF